MIRLATPDDIPEMLDLAEEFHDLSGMPGEFDPGAAARFGFGAIESDEAVALVSPGGMIIGNIVTPMFDPKWRIAVELIWYAIDRNGVALLNAFKQWAIENNADELRLSSINHIGDKAERFALRKGYTIAEQSYRLLL